MIYYTPSAATRIKATILFKVEYANSINLISGDVVVGLSFIKIILGVTPTELRSLVYHKHRPLIRVLTQDRVMPLDLIRESDIL